MYCFSTGFNCIVSVLGLIVLFQSWIYLCCFSPGFNCVVSVLDLIVLLQSWILRVDVFFTLNFLTIPDIDPTRTLPIFKAISKTEINLIILSMFLHYKVQYTWCMLSCLRSEVVVRYGIVDYCCLNYFPCIQCGIPTIYITVHCMYQPVYYIQW